MKLPPKWLLAIIALFLIANVYIFINRNNKFEYVRYSGVPELYPDEPNASFLNKWNSCNQSFSSAELNQGISLLTTHTGIDTVPDDRDKVIRIAGWLYQSFHQQQGTPDLHLSTLTPFQQYNFLKSNSEKKLWCGHFQRMFGFFCTAAGLQNRYIEIVPVKGSVNAGYHEVNEVYLPATKKWVMADVTRNFFLISKDDQALTAAGYLNYRLQEQRGNFVITCFDNDTILTKSLANEKFSNDIYFNKNYFLRYYLNLDLSEVYSPVQKVKRYILADPWYEIYGPGLSHTTIFFRIKQFFFFGFLVSVLIVLFYALKNKKSSTS